MKQTLSSSSLSSNNNNTDVYNPQIYQQFMETHRITDQSVKPTHTRIGNSGLKIASGKYHIGKDELKDFHDLYYNHVLIQGYKEYLTEYQLEEGPILVDMDFRFPLNINTRIYGEQEIQKIVLTYTNHIVNFFEFTNETKFPIYIFEKPKPVQKVSDNLTKDGIHMVIGIHANRTIQHIIRNAVMSDLEKDLCHLPHQNGWDDILDDRITSGKNAWQMYGSRKPAHDAYRLTYFYTVEMSPDGSIGATQENLDNINMQTLFEKLSAQYTRNITLNVRDDQMSFYENEKAKRVRRTPAHNPVQAANVPTVRIGNLRHNMSIDDINLCTIQNQEDLVGAANMILSNLHSRSYDIREAHEYALILPEKYYGTGSFEKWIRVGWALKNTDPCLFLTWMLFSSKWQMFQYTEIPALYEQWKSFQPRDSKLNVASIIYWARTDATEEYNNLRKSSVQTLVKESILSPNHYNFARVLHFMYKGDFKCASVKDKLWYQFINHRWKSIDSATELFNRISTELFEIYNEHWKAATEKCAQVRNEPLEAEMTDTERKLAEREKKERMKSETQHVTNIKEICNKLKDAPYKENIVKESARLFYDPDFMNKLDENRWLLCFNNGVLDFNADTVEGRFRDGNPDDYISKCTGINYIPLQETDPEIRDEINDFFKKVMPKPAIERYMWDYLASLLIGGNFQQSFNIWIGNGSNGKSLMMGLVDKIMGEYKCVVPFSLLSGPRLPVGGTCTELVMMKGMRVCVAQEPTKDVALNEGVIKELTGLLDKITARGLYQNHMTEYIPLFKLLLCTNFLPTVKSNDGGTWRRLKVVLWMSKFVDNPRPTPENPFVFLKDITLVDRLDVWKETFASMLAEISFVKKGFVESCEEVEEASNDYKKREDVIGEFLSAHVVPESGSKIKTAELNDVFKSWFLSNHGQVAIKTNFKDLHLAMDNTYGKKVGPSGWQNVRLKLFNEEDDDDAGSEESSLGTFR